MSIKAYDDAIINEFRRVFNSETVYILPVENAVRFMAQLKKDNVLFPLISTMRLGFSIRGDKVNQNAKMIGSFAKREDNNNIYAQCIPIRIEYQLDIFAVDKETCDNISRELIFYIYQQQI